MRTLPTMEKRLNSFREDVAKISPKDTETRANRLTHDRIQWLDTGVETERIAELFS